MLKRLLETILSLYTSRTNKRYIITGTDTSLGSKDLDHSFEYAYSPEQAMEQAYAHAAGTRFFPESVELDPHWKR
jgi:hypothetical protein